MTEQNKGKKRPKSWLAKFQEDNIKDTRLIAIATAFDLFNLPGFCGECGAMIKSKQDTHCRKCGTEIDYTPKPQRYIVIKKPHTCPICKSEWDAEDICCPKDGAKLE